MEDIPRDVVVTTRSGLRIRVMPDGMYYHVYFWGDYEPLHTKIYRRIVQPGDTVLDVGANFGWFTAAFARWVGQEGRVHAFEPVPFIRELAQETVLLNDVGSRVQLNSFGLGRSETTVPMFTYRGLPHGHATIVDLGRDDAERHVCRLRRLDDYCDENGIDSFRLLKADVEGAELDVFMGGERTLSREGAPIVAFELNRDCLVRRSLRGSDVIGALREFGYTAFYSFSIREGIRPLMDDDLEDANCLAVKSSRRGDIASALRTGRLFR